MTWHADTVALDRYARGVLSDIDAASIEAHVTTCAECRQLAVARVDRDALDRIKHGVDDRLDAPPVPWAPRLLMRTGVSDRDAWLVAGTLSMEAAWCVASLLAVCFAVVASNATSNVSSLAVFLVVAPLAPLVGIAVSFGRRVDPTFEIARACPTPAMRILLVRAVAILGVTIPVLAVVSAFFLEALAFGWLLPAFALATATLAVGTFVPLFHAAAGFGVLWVVGAIVALSDAPRTTAETFARAYVMFRGTGQFLSVVIIVAALATLAIRRSSFEVNR